MSLTYGTAYFDLEADPALFERAVRALAEGNSIHSTARIVQIDKDTVPEAMAFQPDTSSKLSRISLDLVG